MPEMSSNAADPEAGTDGRLNGVVDVPRANRVAGWAIDRADPEAAVTVRVTREGRVVAELRADTPRPDLERNGIGTGRYGFSVDLDPPLEPGFEFTIEATAHVDGVAPMPLRRIGRAADRDEPGRRLPERTFEEVVALRARLETGLERDTAPLRETLDRIEIVQARIETALGGLEAPPRTGGRGLGLAVAAALAIGAGSLALGLWSLFGA
ncbi:hypothetical protein LX81_01754 [Palleronia aestuarii]|uniref:Uncharacterized protein n=1 Tax=Palleronia aestuarii TaxID=568105 RepID=A0A2W7P0Z2_9RHOB|nr:hypothetical protein [Palleronia aestuarii]PZX17122.1 hypothetical protein LX81_01754 [Palleronia aestuarii]